MKPILDLWALFYYRWARHDLQRKDPTHPDLPHIVNRIAELEGAQ